MNLTEELKNISSIEVDRISRPSLSIIKRYFEEENPSEELRQKVDMGARMLSIGQRKYAGENTRAALAMKAAAFTGGGPESVAESLSPIIKVGANGQVAKTENQQLAVQSGGAKGTARK